MAASTNLVNVKVLGVPETRKKPATDEHMVDDSNAVICDNGLHSSGLG
jgi:hypothetical protein